jgi:hypothetical protein
MSDEICVYLRDLRAICDAAMSSVSICVICGLCDGAMAICADLRYLRFLRAMTRCLCALRASVVKTTPATVQTNLGGRVMR